MVCASLDSSDGGLSLLTDENFDGLVSDLKPSSLGVTEAVEDWVRVCGSVDPWDGVKLLLNVTHGNEVLNDEWDLLLNKVLLELPEGQFLNGSDFVRHEYLSRVALEVLGNVWLFNGDLVWSLLPNCLFKFALDGVWLFLVLGNSDLSGDDVWNLLDDGVVDSLGTLIWDFNFFLKWDLVVDGVWNLLGHNIWDLVGDSVWHLPRGGVWDFDLDLIWDLSLNSVWDLSCNLNWLKSLDLVLLGDVLSLANLVWNLLNGHNWDFLGNLVLLCNILSHGVDMSVIGRICSCVLGPVIGLSPLSGKAFEAKSTTSSTTGCTARSTSSLTASSSKSTSIEADESTEALGTIKSIIDNEEVSASGGSGSLAISELLSRDNDLWL